MTSLPGYTLLVIRVESVLDSLPKDFDFEAEAYSRCVRHPDSDAEKDGRYSLLYEDTLWSVRQYVLFELVRHTRSDLYVSCIMPYVSMIPRCESMSNVLPQVSKISCLEVLIF